VLTVNLHTYQEADPLAQIRWVAEVIARGDVDLVAFQECAQRRDTAVEESHYSVNVRTDNMAKLIVAELAATWSKDFTYSWDWSHYGFTVYEEGSAVLGRSSYSLLEQETRVISTGTDRNDINTRTAIYGAWQVPGLGRVHLFSTHVSWGGPQPGQLTALTTYAAQKAGTNPVLTLLAGDYNMAFGTAGYQQMMSDGGWGDSYLDAAPGAEKDPTLDNDRIDYQFRGTSGQLVPVLAQLVFLQLAAPEAANQRASDHLGVLVHYRLKQ
jgi:maltose 6'-phosphate phosphatase